MPSTIQEVYRTYRDRGLTVLAVNLGEDRAVVARWVKEKGLTTPVLLDPDEAAAIAYRVTATPTVVLVGRDGRLVGRAIGPRDWLGDKGRALFAALLRGPA